MLDKLLNLLNNKFFPLIACHNFRGHEIQYYDFFIEISTVKAAATT